MADAGDHQRLGPISGVLPGVVLAGHCNHGHLGRRLSLAPRSKRESQLDDDADYQTAYQSARTIAVNGGRG
jgi:hypothetical protein